MMALTQGQNLTLELQPAEGNPVFWRREIWQE
jgi:hypothetical protein